MNSGDVIPKDEKGGSGESLAGGREIVGASGQIDFAQDVSDFIANFATIVYFARMKSRISLRKPGTAAQLFATMLLITAIDSGCSKKAPPVVPNKTSIVTLEASSITYTGAASGGVIVLEGTDTVIEKGICYGIMAPPTITDSVVLATGASDSFNCVLKGLSPNANYFIRSFVKTGTGILYGNQVLLRTEGGTVPGGSATRIYLSGGYTNDVFALDAATGKIIWDKKISASYCSSAIYSNGTVIVKGDNNSLTAFDTSGNVRWTRALDGTNNDLRLIPVIAENGIVYCKDQEYTYAIYSSDGSLKWRSDNPNTLTRGDGPLILKDNTIYAQTEYSGLFAFDAGTGNLKWTLDGYGGPMVIFSDVIYLFYAGTATTIFAIDRNTGKLNWASQNFPLQVNGLVNESNGRVYSTAGWVIDSASISATNATLLASMEFSYNPGNNPESYPQGSVYPILADGFALSAGGVYDAITGDLTCALPGYRGGYQGFSGASYLNHVVYYTTAQYDIYSPYNGDHYYSDVYAYDVIAKKQLWDTQIENTDLFGVEPCVIDQFANSYRGAFTFK